jgi:hypothetical protein
MMELNGIVHSPDTLHVVLCGDSSLNNSDAIPTKDKEVELTIDGELTRMTMESNTFIKVLATSGHCMKDFSQTQLPQIPGIATHVFISVGGNDALARAKALFTEPDKISLLWAFMGWLFYSFGYEYADTMNKVRALKLKAKIFVCTLYSPSLKKTPWWKRVLCRIALFQINRVIRKIAFQFEFEVVDLATVVDDEVDIRKGSFVELNHHACKKVADVIYRILYPL